MPRSLLAAITSAAVTRTTSGLLRAHPPGGAATWGHTNHAGHQVSLVEGPATAVGLIAGAALAGTSGRRSTVMTAVALGAIAAVGAYDDLCGATNTKGLRGHLRALAHGQVTSGAAKIVVVGAAGLLAATAVRVDRGDSALSAGALADGALVAGTANLVNLLDLRPGRALKASLLTAAVTAPAAPAGPWAFPVLGAAVGSIGADLRGETMLGDCGANTVGAALGLGLVASAPRPGRWTWLGVVLALTLASERTSFTTVIQRHPILDALDRWGQGPR